MRAFLLILFCFVSVILLAQPKTNVITVKGTVFDITAQQPIEQVAVMTTLGNGTFTDSLGKFAINCRLKDSIWFSMLGKTTFKFTVDTIQNLEAFNISLHVRAENLPEVKVRNRSYKLDSIQNRQDYAKIFNFKKPTINITQNNNYNPGSLSTGFDLESIINMFRVKRNRSILKLQQRLLQQEQDKYIDFRFNKNFVRKLTKLQSPELDTFMVKYRPDYDFIRILNDIEFGAYIQKSYNHYKSSNYKVKSSLRKRDD